MEAVEAVQAPAEAARAVEATELPGSMLVGGSAVAGGAEAEEAAEAGGAADVGGCGVWRRKRRAAGDAAIHGIQKRSPLVEPIGGSHWRSAISERHRGAQ